MPSPQASRRNLQRAIERGRLKRLRSDTESHIIKLLVWQSRFQSGQRPSQRALARQLGVSQPYIHKLLRKANAEGMDELLERGGRATLDDLADARRFTAHVRKQEPDLLAAEPQLAPTRESPLVKTAEDIQREAQELIRQAHRRTPLAEPRTMREWREVERRGRPHKS